MEKVSVIMPVYLGDYDGCASDRKEKFIRAVNSFCMNDYLNKELIIVGDFCDECYSILENNFKVDLIQKRIKFFNFHKKQKLFSGKLRTKGISLASGKYIMYLDSDDMLGEKHISTIIKEMESLNIDWCYYNDFIMNEENKLIKKDVELEHGSIGTSSIAHINNKKLNWKFCNGYGHDWKFVKKLMRFSNNFTKVYGATYIICHIPKIIDK